jgi:aldehyde dehydrogenase (NAD+)
VGPLINHAVEMYNNALTKVVAEGGKLVAGGVLSGEGYESGCYVKPAIAETENTLKLYNTKHPFIFIEILRNCRECHCYSKRSSSRFIICNHDNNLREAELFLSVVGSDCGIANVNIGTSGAEIEEVLLGRKKKQVDVSQDLMLGKCMRRQTNTINYTTSLPLAQGIKFDL